MLLSLMYEGRFHTFSPVTYLDRTDVTVIRPMIYVHEADVIGFKNRYNLPVVKSPCPVDGYTKRQYAHDLVNELTKANPGVKNRMFTAITDSNIPGWTAALRYSPRCCWRCRTLTLRMPPRRAPAPAQSLAFMNDRKKQGRVKNDRTQTAEAYQLAQF